MTAVANMRMKLTCILAVIAIPFICDTTYPAAGVGSKAPKIKIRQWLTPNPPTAEQIKGSVCVIEFWATWCPFCVETIPDMIKLTQKYTPKGVLFIALSQDASFQNVGRMIRQKKINYHVAMDGGMSRKFVFQGIPHVFVINHTGQIVWQGDPNDAALETAIVNALEQAPPPFLAGIELGPFEKFRLPLSGGRGFAKTYRQLRIEAKKKQSPDAQIADEITKEIDSRINDKISEAEKSREDDPLAAFRLYERIAKNYKGARPAIKASTQYTKLKNDPNIKNQIDAADAMSRIERLSQRCKPCSACRDFNLECRQCRRLNKIAVERLKKRLEDICQNYETTTAAEKARNLLKSINSQTPKAE